MGDPGIHFGVSGNALVRAAEAMLRALGGAEVTFLFPLLQLPEDSSAELGMVDPGVEEVRLSPVVVRNLVAEAGGPRRRLEFLVPAAAVTAELGSRNIASAGALFDSALGVMYDGDLFHIEGLTTEYFGGMAYLYRVAAVE